MRKRYYIFVVTHDWDGQLRRLHIPVHLVALFLAFAIVGAGSVLGLAGSYGRMLSKVRHYNELRSEKELLARQLDSARKDVEEQRAEVASLGTLAIEISSLYGLRQNPATRNQLADVSLDQPQYSASVQNFEVLKASAMSGSLAQSWTLLRAPEMRAPGMWPVAGIVTGGFGQRLDPFNGEGAFHSGIDISAAYGTPVHVTGDGAVVFAGDFRGYGRTVIVDHGQGIRTLYAHLSKITVTDGQRVRREDSVGAVGLSGRSTGAHLHYEVRINDTPVNPRKFLR